MPSTEAERSMRLFAAEVLPALQDLDAARKPSAINLDKDASLL